MLYQSQLSDLSPPLFLFFICKPSILVLNRVLPSCIMVSQILYMEKISIPPFKTKLPFKEFTGISQNLILFTLCTPITMVKADMQGDSQLWQHCWGQQGSGSQASVLGAGAAVGCHRAIPAGRRTSEAAYM